jgi:hypothetical protein
MGNDAVRQDPAMRDMRKRRPAYGNFRMSEGYQLQGVWRQGSLMKKDRSRIDCLARGAGEAFVAAGRSPSADERRRYRARAEAFVEELNRHKDSPPGVPEG